MKINKGKKEKDHRQSSLNIPAVVVGAVTWVAESVSAIANSLKLIILHIVFTVMNVDLFFFRTTAGRHKPV